MHAIANTLREVPAPSHVETLQALWELKKQIANVVAVMETKLSVVEKAVADSIDPNAADLDADLAE
jgi:hypothetical protein